MAEEFDNTMDDCNALAEPMGDLIGGAATVPAFVGGFFAGGGSLRGTLLGGAQAATTYEAVSDYVRDNWQETICEPMAASAQDPDVFAPLPAYLPPPPETPAYSPDLASNDFGQAPFSGGPSFGDAGSYDGS